MASSVASTPNVDASLALQQTSLLYRNAGVAQATNVFNATLLAYVNVDLHVSPTWAFVWWCIFVVIAGARYQVSRRFHAVSPDAVCSVHGPWIQPP